MTVLDYFVLIVATVSIASGALRGILKGILSVVSAGTGLLAAIYLYGYAAAIFSPVTKTERAANLLGFVAVFFIAGSLLSRFLRGTLKRARLSWVDHSLGRARLARLLGHISGADSFSSET